MPNPIGYKTNHILLYSNVVDHNHLRSTGLRHVSYDYWLVRSDKILRCVWEALRSEFGIGQIELVAVVVVVQFISPQSSFILLLLTHKVCVLFSPRHLLYAFPSLCCVVRAVDGSCTFAVKDRSCTYRFLVQNVHTTSSKKKGRARGAPVLT